MNIFVLSRCPVEAAQMQCNKHVVKMIVESAQMLSTSHRMLDGKLYKGLSKSGKRMVKKWKLSHNDDIVYNAVHVGHPCTVWTMKSIENYKWHYEHFEALCKEYTLRYGKIHASWTKLGQILSVPPKNIPQIGLTKFALAMNDQPQCMFDDPVKAYKAFYQTKQDRFKMEWTVRDVPSWFVVV
jgi:hypothetical protein